jgi:hypothetical protein
MTRPLNMLATQPDMARLLAEPQAAAAATQLTLLQLEVADSAAGLVVVAADEYLALPASRWVPPRLPPTATETMAKEEAIHHLRPRNLLTAVTDTAVTDTAVADTAVMAAMEIN